MAGKKSNIIIIALLLALAATSVSETFADTVANNLVQLDLKRSSNNSVDITLFTSENYDDNVIVRKKSDNKYVLLIPKVQSHGFTNSGLTGVKDLVSNIDVKTVDDTSGGYTKVTLITTKPLDIKTNTQKSAPVTPEQKEYRTLIAQANAVKNNMAKQMPPQKQEPPKTEVTINKAKIEPRINTAIKGEKKTAIKQQNITQKIPDKQQVKKQKIQPQTAKKTEIKLTEITPQNADRITRREQFEQLINEVRQEQIAQQVPVTAPLDVHTAAGTTFDEPVKDIKELPQPHDKTILTNIKEKALLLKTKLSNIKFSNLPRKAGILLIPVLALMIFINLIKASLIKSKELKESFIEHLAKHPPVVNTVKYNNIVNNEELSWQEKYQRYLDESAKPVARANNKGHYAFIKNPAPVKKDETTLIEKKRKELEKVISETAEFNISQDDINEFPEVYNEADTIQKTIKFKAFDNHKNSLSMSKRDKIRSRFKKYENEIPLKEQKNIELGNSILHSNPRKLKNANLDVSSVNNRGIRMRFKPTDYIMSSLEEFFSIPDAQNVPKPASGNSTNPISAKSPTENKLLHAPQKEFPQSAKNVKISQTNPIAKLHNENKSSYINGLIVKSGFNIDENRGFYIVNLDGESSLIGKVNDEVFVLKKFNTNITDPIQVRHDNANVYMVKAGGFKSLVEVNDNKMGVLIEL